MRIQTLLMTLGTLLTAVPCAWSGEPDAPAAPAPSAPAANAAPERSYDELFSDILQNLPEKNRAKVDSARANANGPKAPDDMPEKSNKPDPAELAEKRKKALEKLSPDVKARVEKTIKDLENRRKDRELEFKELDK